LFRLLEGFTPTNWNDAASLAGSGAAVRHVLATESSVPTWRRVAAHDTHLGDKMIPAGAEILLELSGNDITSPAALANQSMLSEGGRRGQSTGSGLVFGSGIHRCLGAKLAELEAAIIVQETATALPEIQLRGQEPDWIRLLSFQAPRTVAVMKWQGRLRGNLGT
jgi:cytochrome P450